MTLSITTISILTLWHYAQCRCAECRNLIILMLNVIMPSVVMLSVITLSIVAPLTLPNLLNNIIVFTMCLTYLSFQSLILSDKIIEMAKLVYSYQLVLKMIHLIFQEKKHFTFKSVKHYYHKWQL